MAGKIVNTPRSFSIALVTAPDTKTARNLARAALKARLIACANVIPAVESHYWWLGKIQQSREVLLLLKTRHPSMRALERLILKLHPYDTPEFVVIPIRSGNRKYLAWLAESTGASQDLLRITPDKKRVALARPESKLAV